jgi:hypothetical protein
MKNSGKQNPCLWPEYESTRLSFLLRSSPQRDLTAGVGIARRFRPIPLVRAMMITRRRHDVVLQRSPQLPRRSDPA